jgi:glycosyltransferase involved in cell wall biosynthesis
MASPQSPPVLQVLQPADGGVARHALDLTLGLRSRGWPVEVMAPPGCTILPRLESEGVQVHRVPMTRAPSAGDLAALRALRELDGGRRYGIVHAHSSKAGGLVRLALRDRRRLVYTPHCFPFLAESFHPVARAAYRLAERALARRSAAIVAVSEWEARAARSLGGGAAVEVIPNGAHPCTPAEPDPGLMRFKADRPLAGLLSVLRPQKDPLALVRASALLAKRGELRGRVAIVGNGELAGAVGAEIERLGVGEHVRWFPFGGDSAPYLAALDLLVVPSRWESMPIGPIEAMFCGVPVLATAVGGVPELVEDGVTGRLVPPGDVDALADALRDLLAAPERLRELGGAARADAEARRGTEPMIEATAALYERLIQRSSAAPLS